ncbi:MAG TPA: Dyp-type peroxidase [Acidimicrobiales bacterium]|nr:Dyp-type peroxidase [Acidimicrobiales bacterium]
MSGVSRRRFLAGGLASTAAAAGVAGGVAACGDDDPGTAAGARSRYLAFEGEHQTGITHPANEQGLLASFTVTAGDRAELAAMFGDLTDEIRRLMSGEPYEDRDPAYPPVYTGTVGNPPPPADLSVVVSVGASLFDDRYGLGDRRPAGLEQMPFLANDRLDPTRSHGDVLLSVTSAHEDINLFALRQLARATRDSLALHWMLGGYNRRTEARRGEAGKRNLMGFIDGTANLDPTDGDVMDRYVWIQPGDDEPDWTVGGSYHVVRVIRMLVEFWDRTRLSEQEALIGRRKDTGAPLDGEAETDVPDFAADPDGDVTPLDAHIRLANPRTPETADDRIFRSGLSFSRGFDAAGQLDQGLAFVSFQRRMSQFLNTQERLAGEPLEEYIRPEGGGFYFALPGVTAADGILGESLLA